MTLGEIIKNYRSEHNLSQTDFANRSGFSRGYVSMLENNRNPQSGLPIALTLETMQKAAIGMNISVNELFALVDQPLDLSVIPSTPSSIPLNLTPHEHELILAYRSRPDMQTAVDTLLGLPSKTVQSKNA